MGQPSIVAPGDLKIPDKIREVVAKLDEEGQRGFSDEMLSALQEAKQTNDLAPVQYLVDAWWVSSIFLAHERIDDALAAAEAYQGAAQMTPEEVGALLGVA